MGLFDKRKKLKNWKIDRIGLIKIINNGIKSIIKLL
jgi:hypothetical protein